MSKPRKLSVGYRRDEVAVTIPDAGISDRELPESYFGPPVTSAIVR